MTSFARIALGCAVGLVAAAGAVIALGDDAEPVAALSSGVVASTPAATSAAPGSTATTPATTPTARASTPSASPTPTGPRPLSAEAATAIVPAPGGNYVAADVPVEVSSVCDGAALDLASATPLYASLQTAAAPLRYLDVALAVYNAPDSAERAYDDLATAVESCPLDRTVTPTPTPGATAGAPIEVAGQQVQLSIGTQPAVQWIQLQTVDSPETQLRTAVTVTRVENVLVVVSVDQDSETAAADEVAAASLGHADYIAQKLEAAAGA